MGTERNQIPTCRTCGEEIMFVRTRATGKLMPVNYGLDPEGNLAAKRHHRGKFYDAHVLTEGEKCPVGYMRLMAHWKTCTDPDKHRKPRTPAPTRAPATRTPDGPAPAPTLFD